ILCLAYYSPAAPAFGPDALGPLLDQSQRRNAGNGVTGLLCHYDGSFLQFLEGEPAAVDETFKRISADPRHCVLLVVHREPIAERAFANWSMSLVELDRLAAEEQAFCTALREVEI